MREGKRDPENQEKEQHVKNRGGEREDRHIRKEEEREKRDREHREDGGIQEGNTRRLVR